MLGQLVGIFIPTLLEEPAQQKIVLVRLHVVLKRRSARASLPIDGLVVDKGPHRSLSLVDLGADGLQIVCSSIDALYGALRCVQDLIGFLN